MELMPICTQDRTSINGHRQQSSYPSMLGDQVCLPEAERGLLEPICHRSSSLPIEFPSPIMQAEGVDHRPYQSDSCYLSPSYQPDLDPFSETGGIVHRDCFDLAYLRDFGEPNGTNTRHQCDRFSDSIASFGHAFCYDHQHEVKLGGLPGSWLSSSIQTNPLGQFATTLSMTGSELRPQSTSSLTQALPLGQTSSPTRKTPRSHQVQQPVDTIQIQQTPNMASTAYPTNLVTDPSETQRHSSCTSYPTVSEARCERDAFLLRSKSVGMSYREIKVQGRFKEAESTLRGRFRTLTKTKDQRVRKPQWQDQDVGNDPLILVYRHAYILTWCYRYSYSEKQSSNIPPSKQVIPTLRAPCHRVEKYRDLQKLPGNGLRNMWQGMDRIISETQRVGRNGTRSMDLLCRRPLRVYRRHEFRSCCEIAPDVILSFWIVELYVVCEMERLDKVVYTAVWSDLSK